MKDLLYLQVETTNFCNSKCVFCPHEQITQKGLMSDDLYMKIVDDASTLPALKLFQPMLNGEPFLDKGFLDKLWYARGKLRNAKIEVYTNGSLLTEAIVNDLAKVPDLFLSVSVNGTDRETRRNLMGLDDYDHVMRMLELMKQEGVKYRVTLVAHPSVSKEQLEDFMRDGGLVIRYQSWAGTQYPYERKRWAACPRAINQMTVLYTGTVCLCCFDPLGEVVFGDLNIQSIEEVWHTKYHQEYQSIHKQGLGNELTKCKACTES